MDIFSMLLIDTIREEIETGMPGTISVVFFEIEDAQIIRVKAIRKQMRLKGGDLRKALFRKTLDAL